MRILVTRALRFLRATPLRIVAVSVILASGMAMYVGLSSAIDSLRASRDHYYAEGDLADLELRFLPQDRGELPDLRGIEGVVGAEARMVVPGTVDREEAGHLPVTLVATDQSGPRRIDTLTILEGSGLAPGNPSRVVVDRNMARYNDVQVGDRLSVRVGRDRYEVIVAGVALSPEYLLAPADPSFFLPTKGSAGVLYVPLRLFSDRLGFDLVNSAVFELENPIRPRIPQVVDALRGELDVEEVLPYDKRFAHLFLEVDLHAFEIFVPAIFLIFSITAGVVTLFLLVQWITTQRSEIGVFLSLGYGRGRIAASYGVPLAVIAAGAIAVGVPMSYLVLEVFSRTYAGAIGFPEPLVGLTGSRLVEACAGVVLTLALAASLPLLRLFSFSPRATLRAEDGSRSAALGGVGRALASVLPGRLWLRYASRNLLRSKAASLTTIASVALALGVSLAYAVALRSYESTLVQRTQDDAWDLVVDFTAPMWDDELGGLRSAEGVTTVDPFVRGTARLAPAAGADASPGARRFETALLTGVDPRRSLRSRNVTVGRNLREGDRGVVVLEKNLAADLGYEVGDRVRLEARGNTSEPRLVGLLSGTFPGEAYAPIADARKWLELEDQSTGAFLDLAPSVAATEPVTRALYDLPRIARVTPKSRLIDLLVQASREIATIIYVAAVFSVGVALLFMVSSASFTILQRRAEYAMLSILGFSGRFLTFVIVGEIALLGVLGAALTGPVGLGLALYLNRKLSEAWFGIGTVFSPVDLAAIALPAIVLFAAVGWGIARSVRSGPLVEVLRRRRFG
ncbi:MAG: hypothetical protein PVG07_03145 [Acidobacteriota bacterium]|jgi:ABC-type lipoprotein release transport system permease subunit